MDCPHYLAPLDCNNFWNALEDLLALLQPIHERQKMSESGKRPSRMSSSVG